MPAQIRNVGESTAAFATALRAGLGHMDCRCDSVGRTTGVPLIAADLPQHPSRQSRANTRHPNTCEPNPERFAQEERSRALRFSGNGPVGGREYGSRANQELQALVHILTLPAALVSSIFSFALRFVRVPSTPFCAFVAEQGRRL